MRPARLHPLAAALALAATACTLPSPPEGPCRPRGGEVKLALATLPVTLDWMRSSLTSAPNYPVLQAVMRGLTALGPDGAPVPDLATSWELSTSPGGKPVYTFHLADATWSDGVTPLVAEDFVFAWRRALGIGLEPRSLEDLDGAAEVIAVREDPSLDAAARARRLEEALAKVGVAARDRHTLVVTLAGPRSYFLARLAGLYTYDPAPSGILGPLTERERARWFDDAVPGRPLVLGAFEIEAWDRVGQRIVLRPNPHAAPGLAAGATRLTLLRSDLAPLLYEQCKVDTLLLDDPAVFARAPPDAVRRPLLSTYWLGVNAAKVPPDLRRAIALALDRRVLLDGLVPGARAAVSYLPPELSGAPRPGDPEWAALPAPDPARARALAAPFRGRELTLLVRGTGTFLPEVGIADGVARQLEDALGVRVTVVTTGDFGSAIVETVAGRDGTRVTRTAPDLFLRRLGADYAHPQTFLSLFQPGGNHHTMLPPAVEAELEALLRAGAAETDTARMRVAYGEAQAILQAREVVVVPLLHPDRALRRRPWITGLEVDRFNFLTFRGLRVNGAPP